MNYTAISIVLAIAATYLFYNEFSTMISRILPGFDPVIFGMAFIFLIGGIVYAMTR